MPNVKAEMLEYGDSDEHVLRRIGGAVVVQWDNLPNAAQELILEQANFMYDRDETVQLREQLEAFINRHKQKS